METCVPCQALCLHVPYGIGSGSTNIWTWKSDKFEVVYLKCAGISCNTLDYELWRYTKVTPTWAYIKFATLSLSNVRSWTILMLLRLKFSLRISRNTQYQLSYICRLLLLWDGITQERSNYMTKLDRISLALGVRRSKTGELLSSAAGWHCAEWRDALSSNSVMGCNVGQECG